MALNACREALDYAVKVGAPFWFDGDWCVYTVEGFHPHCVVAGFTRRVMYAGCFGHHEFAESGLARNLSLHAVACGCQCLATSFGCVFYGGGCAVIVKGSDVNIIGRVTQFIRWDGSVEGHESICDLLEVCGVWGEGR